MTRQLLMIEIKTIENSDISIDALPTITIYQDSQNNYFLSTGIEEIKNAVLGMLPHLNTNCRHLLLFSVRLLPGSKTDAYLNSLNSSNDRKRATNLRKP